MKNTVLFSSSELTAESFRELLPIFFEEVKDDFILLRNAFLNKNTAEALRLSHKIKGCASSYAATLINEKALSLQLALTAESATAILEVIQELEEAINRSYQFAQEKFQIE